jgi:hypothetical protein
MNSNKKETCNLARKTWTVKHNEDEFNFETLDAAVWYATGAESVSNSVTHINARLRVITLLPAINRAASNIEKMAA